MKIFIDENEKKELVTLLEEFVDNSHLLFSEPKNGEYTLHFDSVDIISDIQFLKENLGVIDMVDEQINKAPVLALIRRATGVKDIKEFRIRNMIRDTIVNIYKATMKALER